MYTQATLPAGPQKAEQHHALLVLRRLHNIMTAGSKGNRSCVRHAPNACCFKTGLWVLAGDLPFVVSWS